MKKKKMIYKEKIEVGKTYYYKYIVMLWIVKIVIISTNLKSYRWMDKIQMICRWSRYNCYNAYQLLSLIGVIGVTLLVISLGVLGLILL